MAMYDANGNLTYGVDGVQKYEAPSPAALAQVMANKINDEEFASWIAGDPSWSKYVANEKGTN